MGTTEDALNKLNKKQLRYCKICSGLINTATVRGIENLRAKEAGHLRGYLECMRDMDILSETEAKQLYAYFFLTKRLR